MSEDDRSKRQKAQNEKRKKLINPLFFVSAHRLSIRNLAKSVTDNELKTLCIAALKTGNDVPRKIEFECVWNCVFRVYCFRMLYILQYNGLLGIVLGASKKRKEEKKCDECIVFCLCRIEITTWHFNFMTCPPRGGRGGREEGRAYFISLSGYILFSRVA